MRVAIYLRKKPDNFAQETSAMLLKCEAVSRVRQSYPDAVIAGCYIDEGDSKQAFRQMMKDAEAGKFDRIETKSVHKFIDDAGELINLAARLKGLDRPVRIHFEHEGITTGTTEWVHCINFLMSFLESAYRNTQREGTRCRI